MNGVGSGRFARGMGMINTFTSAFAAHPGASIAKIKAPFRPAIAAVKSDGFLMPPYVDGKPRPRERPKREQLHVQR